MYTYLTHIMLHRLTYILHGPYVGLILSITSVKYFACVVYIHSIFVCIHFICVHTSNQTIFIVWVSVDRVCLQGLCACVHCILCSVQIHLISSCVLSYSHFLCAVVTSSLLLCPLTSTCHDYLQCDTLIIHLVLIIHQLYNHQGPHL